MLAAFTRNLPLTLAVLALLVALVVLGLVLLVRKRRVPAPAAGEGEALPPGEMVVDFRDSGLQPRIAAAFRRARQTIRRRLGRGGLYRVPWFLLLGEAAAAKGRTLEGAGLPLPLGAPESASAEDGAGCVFWFFEQGVVLDLAGDCVLRPDGSSDAGAWRQFLRLLREKRPERPFDGVVLALPCAGLLGSSADEGHLRASEKGDALYRRLREAQEQTGMVFPVYVLVTGCQQVPGFAAFASELPEAQRGDLLGWSNPYALETAFRSEWVDEAFGALGAGLHRAQLDAFGEQPVVEDADGVFCFPDEMEGLREGLRTALPQIFRSSAYHEILPCRGVYFCGGLETAAAAGGGLAFDAPAPAATVFARDVFERKVFPERDLGRPGSRALARGTRRLRYLQAGVAVLALVITAGLSWASYRLHAREAELTAFFQLASRNVREVREQRRQGTLDAASAQARTFEIFDGLAHLNGSWFGSVFVPSSWFSNFNAELKRALATLYEEIVFTSLRQELERKLDRTLAVAGVSRPAGTQRSGPSQASYVPRPEALSAGLEAPAAGSQTGESAEAAEAAETTAAEPVVDLESLGEFTRLRGYVTDLQALETNVKRYNGLRDTASLQDLDAVVTYVFQRSLPSGIFENNRLYRTALSQVHYRPIKPLDSQPTAVDGAANLREALFSRLFARNPAALELVRASTLLEQVTAPAAGNDPEGLAQSLAQLRDHLLWADADFAEPALAWLSRENLALGPHYEQLLDGIGRSEYLGTLAADDFRKKGDDDFRQLRQRLRTMETPSTGLLVQTDPKTAALALSDPAKQLASALNGLVNQGMIAGGGADDAARLVPRQRVNWDTQRLQQAAGLYKPAQESLDKLLAHFPASLRDTLQQSALDQLGSRMMEKVVEAQRPSGEPEVSSPLAMEQSLDTAVANFQAAAPSLTELSGTFASLGRGADQTRVTAAFAAQGEGILGDAGRLLRLLAPYTPKGNGFDWWDGKPGAALAAFNSRDESELMAYLATQRNALSDLSTRYVEPVIQAFGRGLPPSPVLRRELKSWTGLADQLRRYAAKEPGNSVSALEELILKDLSQVEPAGCTTRITAAMLTEPAADFFQERRKALRQEMRERCVVLAGTQAAEDYAQLEAFFNQRLARRFPFSDDAPGRPGDEADPGDLREFFRLYDAYAPVVKAVPAPPPGTRDFVDGMAKVRTFFAAFLDDPLQPAAPSFDVEVRFRENRQDERGGDRILRWSVASGERVVTYPGAGARGVLRWQAGDPLRLELQWAKDSPVVPVESPAQPGVVRVEGFTAVIERSGRWSLLALLDRLKVPNAAADPAAQLLRLAVSTKPVADSPAQVFLGLALRPPQSADKPAKDQPPVVAANLKVPRFPVEAPRWTAAPTSFARPSGGRP